ncbi:MAG: sel1 repeat family protein [Proteobacteria bacterium]|nr:sel1 repeat family protein [Pseudomonadota bacterium]
MPFKFAPLFAALATLTLSPVRAAEPVESTLSAAERQQLPSLDKLTIAELEGRMAQGDLRAQAELGARYGRGQDVQADVAKAITLLKDAADKNNAEAQHWLATAYANGVGVEKNEAQAALLYEKAAAQGHREAQYMMGVLISNGQAGFSSSWSGAFPFFWKSADQGLAVAEFMIGYIYQEGKIGDVNPQVAAYWYRRALSRGPNNKAAFNLALMVGEGKITWQPGDPFEKPPEKAAGTPKDSAPTQPVS